MLPNVLIMYQMSPLLFGVFLSSLHFSICQHLERNTSAYVEQGIVEGRIWRFGHRKMQEFLGIPYAEPPLGDLRFEKPLKKKRWMPETWQAFDYGPPCLQFMYYHQTDKFAGENMKRQSEDCLYLNIFAPYDDLDKTAVHPVLFWVHGGSFLAGSGDTGIDKHAVAHNLVFRGLVLVTINYRLGPLGFLAHKGDDGLWKGNYGLWDQVIALQWVADNIRFFGGDPRSVTVMGESAGAASVSVLAASPVSRHLVHSAVVMSGSALAGWAMQRYGRPQWEAQNLLRYLRCDKLLAHADAFEKMSLAASADGEGNTIPVEYECNLQERRPACALDVRLEDGYWSEQLVVWDCPLDCLRRELSWGSVLQRRAMTTELGVSKPVVDGELITHAGDDFITENAHVPIMTGVAKREWGHKKAIYYGFREHLMVNTSIMHQRLMYTVSTSYDGTGKVQLSNGTYLLLVDSTFYEYIRRHTDQNEMPLDQFVSLLQEVEADIEFISPCYSEANLYAQRGLPVYLYSFDYVPKSDIWEKETKVHNLFGHYANVTLRRRMHFTEAFHGLDHAYIFTNGYSSNFEVVPYTDTDKLVSATLCTAIANFAKYRDPNVATTKEKSDTSQSALSSDNEPLSGAPFTWPPYSGEQRSYVRFGTEPTVLHAPDFYWPRAQFWTEHVTKLAQFVPKLEIDGLGTQNGAAQSTLTEDERSQLEAYRRAWLALWVLVAAIALFLWVVVGCVVCQRCANGGAGADRSGGNIVITGQHSARAEHSV